jgi:hypothetical protein
MSKARRSEPNVPAGTFREGKRKSRPAVLPPKPVATKTVAKPAPGPARASDLTKDVSESWTSGWESEDSDVYQLSLPPDVTPGDVFPNIESALQAATEQLQRGPSSPELPPIADRYRKSRP